MSGSSPRAWGTEPEAATIQAKQAVHLHGRGEQFFWTASTNQGDGSSPRAWGTALAPLRYSDTSRFIPTGVGNSPSPAPAPVHPHGRGEQYWFPGDHIDNRGSSPRAWGTGVIMIEPEGDKRFIPTGVGNSFQIGRTSDAEAVHPHGRGEQANKERINKPINGSSPRAWGTVSVAVSRIRNERFIPTGVGNRAAGLGSLVQLPVHPHGRGEQRTRGRNLSKYCGSSPRAWGTGFALLHGSQRGRFIPTGVGNRITLGETADPGVVHPHGRGEQRHSGFQPGANGGSSPRAWGTALAGKC